MNVKDAKWEVFEDGKERKVKFNFFPETNNIEKDNLGNEYFEFPNPYVDYSTIDSWFTRVINGGYDDRADLALKAVEDGYADTLIIQKNNWFASLDTYPINVAPIKFLDKNISALRRAEFEMNKKVIKGVKWIINISSKNSLSYHALLENTDDIREIKFMKFDSKEEADKYINLHKEEAKKLRDELNSRAENEEEELNYYREWKAKNKEVYNSTKDKKKCLNYRLVMDMSSEDLEIYMKPSCVLDVSEDDATRL